MPNIFFRGTIGDTYLNLLKVKNLKNLSYNNYDFFRVSKHKINNNNLRYLSKLLGIDKKIQFINDKNFDERNLNKGDIYFEDSKISKFQVKENLFINNNNIKKNKNLVVGIQIDGGSHLGNFRFINQKWIKKLINKFQLLESYNLKFVILGNSNSKINFNNNISITNMSGKLTFNQWVNQILNLDFLISLEGLPIFLALSNKTPVYMVNQYLYEIDSSIHPSWKNLLETYNCNQEVFYKLKKRLIFYFKFKNVITPNIESRVVLEFFKYHYG